MMMAMRKAFQITSSMNSMDDVKQLLAGIKFGSAPIQPFV